MIKKSLLINSRFTVSALIILFIFASFFVYAGTFYSCVDKEGNVTISDHPKYGQACKQVQTYEETKSTREENATRGHVDSADISSGDRTTKIIVSGNRVLVPVTLVYGNNEVNVQLVMDTGATRTTINTEIADQLSINLSKARKGKAEVVGGAIIEVSVIKVNSLIIGPHTIHDWNILAVPHEGSATTYDGLLGMDVLGKFAFHVDSGKQVIIWK